MRTARLLLATLCVGLLLASCAPQVPVSVRLSAGAKVTMSASYRRHSGTTSQALKLEQGEPVSISYQLQVDSGTLQLSIIDPEENEIWQQCFAEDAEDTFTFTVEMHGNYLISVDPEETSGSYDLVCKNTGS